MKEFNLEPRFDSRKSFYGKAKVLDYGNRIELVSYDTIVAVIEKHGNVSQANLTGNYSQTTTRHQKEFLRQYGFFMPSTSKEMFELYKGVK